MLSEGMRADCVVLSGDLLTNPLPCRPAGASCRVELTVVRGEVVCRAA